MPNKTVIEGVIDAIVTCGISEQVLQVLFIFF